LFGLKVPENITVAKWPGHARYGTRAGQGNEAFLNAKLFRDLFAEPLEPYRERVATMIFEFGTFPKATFPTLDDFLGRLDPFLAALPAGFRYGVEIRNPEYLRPAYFTLLASHRVSHVMNAWTRMPDLKSQANLEGVYTADFTVVRALLSRGRTYEKAVQTFEPYKLVQEPDESTRDALRQIALESIRRQKSAFMLVNNRLEGNAPSTIEAVVERLEAFNVQPTG
jgi:uncharacterized protein YecE (DUF72 family)